MRLLRGTSHSSIEQASTDTFLSQTRVEARLKGRLTGRTSHDEGTQGAEREHFRRHGRFPGDIVDFGGATMLRSNQAGEVLWVGRHLDGDCDGRFGNSSDGAGDRLTSVEIDVDSFAGMQCIVRDLWDGWRGSRNGKTSLGF